MEVRAGPTSTKDTVSATAAAAPGDGDGMVGSRDAVRDAVNVAVAVCDAREAVAVALDEGETGLAVDDKDCEALVLRLTEADWLRGELDDDGARDALTLVDDEPVRTTVRELVIDGWRLRDADTEKERLCDADTDEEWLEEADSEGEREALTDADKPAPREPERDDERVRDAAALRVSDALAPKETEGDVLGERDAERLGLTVGDEARLRLCEGDSPAWHCT